MLGSDTPHLVFFAMNGGIQIFWRLEHPCRRGWCYSFSVFMNILVADGFRRLRIFLQKEGRRHGDNRQQTGPFYDQSGNWSHCIQILQLVARVEKVMDSMEKAL